MTSAIPRPGNTDTTFLVHFFNGGLKDGERYAVERFHAMLDGDMRRCHDDTAPKGARREAGHRHAEGGEGDAPGAQRDPRVHRPALLRRGAVLGASTPWASASAAASAASLCVASRRNRRPHASKLFDVHGDSSSSRQCARIRSTASATGNGPPDTSMDRGVADEDTVMGRLPMRDLVERHRTASGGGGASLSSDPRTAVTTSGDRTGPCRGLPVLPPGEIQDSSVDQWHASAIRDFHPVQEPKRCGPLWVTIARGPRALTGVRADRGSSPRPRGGESDAGWVSPCPGIRHRDRTGGRRLPVGLPERLARRR